MRKKTLPVHAGNRPHESRGAVKPPIFMTSTFVFEDYAEAVRFFEAEFKEADALGGEDYVYSRIGHPNLTIAEERLAQIEGAEACLMFNSGMAAITTSLLALLRAGDKVLFSEPVYGGTEHFLHHILPEKGISVEGFPAGTVPDDLTGVQLVYLETPANPTNIMTDIVAVSERRKGMGHLAPFLVVDNTFLGPMFQSPLDLGADLVLYSATKFLSGHSDLIAGAALGKGHAMSIIKGHRSILGTQMNPFDAWLLSRSMETLHVRTLEQQTIARELSIFIDGRPEAKEVSYPGLSIGDQRDVYMKNCKGDGSMISFLLEDGESVERFIGGLSLIKLGVSLGGTESLVQHPWHMTHAGVPSERKIKLGVHEGLVRLSVGIEDVADLKEDLKNGFDSIRHKS